MANTSKDSKRTDRPGDGSDEQAPDADDQVDSDTQESLDNARDNAGIPRTSGDYAD